MAMPEGSPTYDPSKRWGDIFASSGPGPAGSYGAPVTGGPGYKYDEATLHELVTEWRELANEYKADLQGAQYIAAATPPGTEYASGNNADVTRASGKALHDALMQRVNYCNAMAEKYIAALGKYATADETAAEDVKKQGSGIL